MTGDARLCITLLGGFQMARGDRAVPVPGARLQQLVVRLALAGGRVVGQETLIDAIWFQDPPADPAHALQALVSRLRRTLGSASTVVQATGGYRLDIEAADVDALRFENLAAHGRRRLLAQDHRAAAALLDEAMAVWEGPPGAEPGAIAAVAPASATRLAQVSLQAAVDLAEAEVALGNAAAATTRLNDLLAEESLHEGALALLMDALAAQGRQGEALARYEQFREQLADGLGTDPGAALRERHLNLLRTTAAEPPAAAKTMQGPGNLPASMTSFIGREDDLARIDSLLAAGRLATVLGPGGAGKTRLAIEAARRQRPAYPDGVWLVDLTSVSDPDKISEAVLAATGLRGTAFFDASASHAAVTGGIDMLADQLDGRDILLVIDNCEHLIDAVARMITVLLARCGGLSVLATSREPLAIDGEALVPLGPLPLPDPHASSETAGETPSVRLFMERAAAVRPGFEVDDHNLADVLHIVSALDGLPLALELAAARLRTLSLSDLSAGLSDRFRVLTSGNRTASDRHRTLRGVIAWSWDLLEDDARTTAERIAVLPGGITPASAAAVCTGSTVPVRSIPELLADLVDRSLLALEPDTGRHRMLESIREYGLERLDAQHTLGPARDQAAHYIGDLVAHYDPLTRGPQQLHALNTLRAEHDNVIAALRHLCDSSAADTALALALNLTWYWQIRGRHADAHHWLTQVTALPAQDDNVRHDIAHVLLQLHSATGQSALFNNNVAHEQSHAFTRRLLSHRPLPGFTGGLVTIQLALNGPTQPNPALLQTVIDGPDTWLAGYAHLSRAHAAENRGQLEAARDDVSMALTRFTEAGDDWALATALPLRSLLRQYDGELDDALADLRQAKRLAQEFGALSLSDEIFLDLRQFDLLVRLDQTDQATSLISSTRQRALRSTPPEMAILLDARESRLRLQTGDLDRAGQLIDQAEAGLSRRNPLGGEHGQALIAIVRAELCLRRGDTAAAARALHQAYSAAVHSRDLPVVATVAVTVADLAELDHQHHDVARILGAAARLRGAHDPTDPYIRALRARATSALGDTAFAEEYNSGWELDIATALSRVDPKRISREPRGTGTSPR